MGSEIKCNDSTITSYLSMGSYAFVFYMATEDPAFRVAVQAFAIIIVISCVLLLFYAQRIYQFYQQPQNRNVTDARGASSHVSQKSSSASSVMKPGPNANA